MTEYPVTRPLKRPPTHPGELMREILDEHLEMPIAQAARRMGVSRPSLYAVLTGKGGISPEMALRFTRLAGGTPDLLLRMQDSYDLWHAERDLAKDLARIKPAAKAA